MGSKSTANFLPLRAGDTHICYLPYIHSFEQCVTGLLLESKIRIGFYGGDAAKLIEDIMVLKPSWFPSVPRLFNKLYGVINSKFSALDPAVKAGLDKVIAEKIENSRKTPAVYTHPADEQCFSKIKAMLGGNVKFCLTASAPIDKGVFEFL